MVEVVACKSFFGFWGSNAIVIKLKIIIVSDLNRNADSSIIKLCVWIAIFLIKGATLKKFIMSITPAKIMIKLSKKPSRERANNKVSCEIIALKNFYICNVM